MTRCRNPGFCERYKINIVIYDHKSKRITPRSVKQTDNCVYNHRNHYCVIWKKNTQASLLKDVGEIDNNFKYVKNTVNENNLKQIVR